MSDSPSSVWVLLLSPLSLLNSDRITLALPKRLKRARTFSWYHSRVPIFRTLDRGNHGNWMQNKKNKTLGCYCWWSICQHLHNNHHDKNDGGHILWLMYSMVHLFQASALWNGTKSRNASKQILRARSAKPASINFWKASKWWRAFTQSPQTSGLVELCGDPSYVGLRLSSTRIKIRLKTSAYNSELFSSMCV